MLSLLVVFICLFLNAILSCAEMAFVTIDKKVLRRDALGENGTAQLLLNMQESPERILSVVQIGITLVGAISAAVSGAGAEETLSPWLRATLGVSERVSEAMALAMVVGPLTILSVVIGELVPKSIAIRYSYKVSMLLAPGLKMAEKLLGFLVNPMERATNALVDTFLPGAPVSHLDGAGQEVSLAGLKKEQQEYVHNILDLDAKIVRSVMIGWDKVRTIDASASAAEVESYILESGHTRMPVLDHGEVYGFIHLKEFLNMKSSGIADNWLSYIRPPRFVDPHAKLLTALKTMKKQKGQFLIVGTAEAPVGVVTLEDLIEEVVGDVFDESESKGFFKYLRSGVLPRLK